MNNIVGLITSMGGSSFEHNPELVPSDIERVVICSKFFLDNRQYIINNPAMFIAFSEGEKYCSDNNLDFKEFNITLHPLTGSEYEDLLIRTTEYLQHYDSLKAFITSPVGILFSPERIALYIVEEKNNETYFNIDNIFPIEFNEEYEYLVVKIDSNDEDGCLDNSFESISVIGNEDRSILQTFVRVASKNGRWSDWLEYTNNVSLNINVFKLFLETERLVKENIYITSFEGMVNGNYNISINLIKNNGELATVDYSNLTKYKIDNTTAYYIHYGQSMNIGYTKNAFIEFSENGSNFKVSVN